MALHIKTDGTETTIPTPDFERIHDLVGGGFDCCVTVDGRTMFVHDEGLILNLPRNEKATQLYAPAPVFTLLTGIRGDVVVFDLEESRADREG